MLSDQQEAHPHILGTGAVTFPTDDCLVSTRRGLRRTRRHIRSTRDRIERLKKYLLSINFLTREELDRPGHPAPFLLAAATYDGTLEPTALELWNIIRWYAHNRGYDGNSRWSRQEDEDEGDTAKIVEAKKWMSEKGTFTMAHTICRLLELDPSHPKKRISSHLPYKTLNTAYPRSIVTAEVAQILAQSNLPEDAQKLILTDNTLTDTQRETLNTADIKLPKRYEGGLLFGQLVPRFDNRIISRCPITWAEIYQREIDAGTEESKACQLAERDAKVPTKKSREFLDYRFARILANIKLDQKPLPAELRKNLFESARQRGQLTKKELATHIEDHTPGAETNLDSFFTLHPDSEKALILDPVTNEVRKAVESASSALYPLWSHLDESVRLFLQSEWAKGRKVSLATIRRQAGLNPELEQALVDDFSAKTSKAKGKKSYPDFDTFLTKRKAGPDDLTGRAPYARPVLKKVTSEILAGWDATKPAQSKVHPEGEDKPTDGTLYSLLDPSSQVNDLLAKRPLDKLTNNHLVRHRLLILERLVKELIAEFAENEPSNVHTVVVEVARELKEMSGKTAKEIKAELGSRLNDFTKAIKHLEKFAPHLPLNGGLIRKCRIAMDLNWTCPFTGKCIKDPTVFKDLDREHIIPFASRKTNALHALVLTWPEVNRWKGKRTARQFIIDEGGKQVPDRPDLSIMTVKNYDDFVKKLKVSGHNDDRRRQKARIALLKTTEFNENEQGFTDGALTQSSHLIKLALRGLKQQLPAAQHHVIPGIATGEIRKSWKLLELLGDPTVCGREALRWIEDYDHRKRTLTINEKGKYPTFEKAVLIEKKKGGKLVPSLPDDAFSCPNDQCEAPLTWPSEGPSHFACPECRHVLRKIALPKQEIRSLTHLHHALDASTIALVAHYFPLTRNGQNVSGKLWKAMLNRNKSAEDIAFLKQTGLYQFSRKLNDKGREQTRGHLQDLPSEVKKQLITRLAEARVAQHIPADRSGSRAELTTWGVTHIEDTELGQQVHLQQNATEVKDGKRKRTLKKRKEKASKLLGPNPTNGQSKLKDISGALIISDNYGLALDPEPQVIPFHQVHQALEEIRANNNGKAPRLLRNGALIRLLKNPPRSHQNYTGIWRIVSIKDNKGKILLDLIRPAFITSRNGVTWSGMNKTLEPLLECGLEVLEQNYTSHVTQIK